MADQRNFWNDNADRWAERPLADASAHRDRMQTARARLTAETELLDAGCGTGGLAVDLAPHVKRVMAIDFSRRMIELARDRARAAGVANVTFAQMALEDLADAAAWDAVLANLLLHLVDDRPAAIAQVFRLLRPGGLFLSTTHCLGARPVLRMAAPLARAAGMAPRIAFFTPERLAADIGAAGFVIEDVRQQAPKTPAFIVARKPGRGAAVAS